MYDQNILFIALGGWLLILTIFFIFWFSFFRKLTKGVEEKNLRKVLDSILAVQERNGENIDKLAREIRRLEEQGFGHVQKIGIVRFNPFKEIGGDHSFSLAILDGRDTGIILTGLHTRERTRVYAKPIKNGKAEIELSEEERKALEKARKS